MRDFSPGSFFNVSALLMTLMAFGFATFFIGHRIVAGQFTPHIWAGFTAAFLFGLAFMTFGLGQVAAMVARIRRIQDRELYLLRKYLDRGGMAQSAEVSVSPPVPHEVGATRR